MQKVQLPSITALQSEGDIAQVPEVQDMSSDYVQRFSSDNFLMLGKKLQVQKKQVRRGSPIFIEVTEKLYQWNRYLSLKFDENIHQDEEDSKKTQY